MVASSRKIGKMLRPVPDMLLNPFPDEQIPDNDKSDADTKHQVGAIMYAIRDCQHADYTDKRDYSPVVKYI
jgi:hypothetical protein